MSENYEKNVIERNNQFSYGVKTCIFFLIKKKYMLLAMSPNTPASPWVFYCVELPVVVWLKVGVIANSGRAS